MSDAEFVHWTCCYGVVPSQFVRLVIFLFPESRLDSKFPTRFNPFGLPSYKLLWRSGTTLSQVVSSFMHSSFVSCLSPILFPLFILSLTSGLTPLLLRWSNVSTISKIHNHVTPRSSHVILATKLSIYVASILPRLRSMLKILVLLSVLPHQTLLSPSPEWKITCHYPLLSNKNHS